MDIGVGGIGRGEGDSGWFVLKKKTDNGNIFIYKS